MNRRNIKNHELTTYRGRGGRCNLLEKKKKSAKILLLKASNYIKKAPLAFGNKEYAPGENCQNLDEKVF